MHVPPGSYGPERCKTFIHAKLGRAVNTHRYIRKITIVKNIVTVSKETNGTGLAFVASSS